MPFMANGTIPLHHDDIIMTGLLSLAEGKATPYGLDDLSRNAGWVTVGSDHDTAPFAVASIRRWWTDRGRTQYPGAQTLTIVADGGGSNRYRVRLWKAEHSAWRRT